MVAWCALVGQHWGCSILLSIFKQLIWCLLPWDVAQKDSSGADVCSLVR